MDKVRRNRVVLAVAVVALLAFASGAYLRLSSSGQTGGSGRPIPALTTVAASSPEASRYITEYQVAGADSDPNAIASDSRGNIWFTLAADYAIGELDPANGTTHEFRIPGENGSLVSWGLAVDSSRNLVWFTDQLADSVWSFNVTSGSFTRYHVPTPLASPYQVAVDGAGNVWFTEIDGGKIGEITTSGAVREYAVPTGAPAGQATSLTGPAGIAIGKDGTIWFTEVYEDSVGSLANGTFHEYPLTGAVSPTGIALDSQGDAWVTLHGGSDIAELDPSTNSTRIISTSVPSGLSSTLPYFVAVDPHGDVWFDEHYGNAIARFTPSNQTLVEYEIPTRVASLANISGALTIGLDPSGHPWFTEFYAGKVGTVDPGAALGIQVVVGSPSNGTTLDEPSGGNSSVSIRVLGTSPSTLTYSKGTGPDLLVSFSPSSGNGSYSSTMTVERPSGSSSGPSVALTISAVTPQVVCSQVIEVET
ncbi:MAG: SMP-30/gluconolactonase/LRE family protein [Thaumarchaeota archaeon]|nr:SMP-30/gluconolactonase/LRE family protein [Nitrososphaerota archaeon]